MKKSIVILAVLAAFGSFGCSKDCEDMCEESKECPGASAEDKAEDCAKMCADMEKLAEDTKCVDQHDALMDCAADEDVCNESVNSACKSETDAYGTCIAAACIANPNICL